MDAMDTMDDVDGNGATLRRVIPRSIRSPEWSRKALETSLMVTSSLSDLEKQFF